jgi:hypothetical protein
MNSQFHGAVSRDGSTNYADDPMPGEMLLNENVRLNGQTGARGLLNGDSRDYSDGSDYAFTGNPTVEVPRSTGEPTVQTPRDRRGITARNSGPSVETPTDRSGGMAGDPNATRLATGAPPPPLGADYFARYFGPNGSGFSLFGMDGNRPSPSLDYAGPGTVTYANASANYGRSGSAAGEAGGAIPTVDNTSEGFASAEAAGAAETARLRAGGIDPNSATGARVAQAGAGGRAALTPEFLGSLGDAGSRAAAQGASEYQLSGAQFSSRAANALLMASQSNGGDPNNMRGLPDDRSYQGEGNANIATPVLLRNARRFNGVNANFSG